MNSIHRLLVSSVLAVGVPVVAVDALALHAQGQSETADGGHVVTVSDLVFEGEGPRMQRSYWLRTAAGPALIPRVVIDGHSAVLGTPEILRGTLQGRALAAATIAIDSVGEAGDLTGTLYVPTINARSMEAFTFVVPRAVIREDREQYRAAQAAHYKSLRDAGLPGAAWFRRRASAYGAPPADPDGAWTRRGSSNDQDSFAMFTGGRAVSENLRLDEVIRVAAEGAGDLVQLDTIEGVRVPEMEWDGLVEGLEPEIDPLASVIPSDQHAVFFPSFDALVRVADQLADESQPFVQLADGRAEDNLVRERYETQMSIALDALTRRFGSRFIQSVAITGSDPYLRTGSDVAILFEGDVESIMVFVRAKMDTAEGASIEDVQVAGVTAIHASTADRRIDTWLVGLDGVVIVSNSRVQIERVLAAKAGDVVSLDELPETRFFRDRYARGAADEDAFVLVSDATIRRWAGPKWRIASARRTRVGAVLADADAWTISDELGLDRRDFPFFTSPVPWGGMGLVRSEDGIPRDTVYGTRRFLTPIAELDFTQVSTSEKAGYEIWRRGYEAAWGAAFDPLAVRISAREDGLDVDLSIMPLTVRSQYSWMTDLAGDAKIEPGAGDPHPGTIMHWVSAIDHDGPTYRQIGGTLRSIGRGDQMGIDWVGDHVSVWLDGDEEYFERVKDADSMDMFTEEMLPGLPFGVYVDVDSALGLAGFLTGVRVFAEQAVPGLLDFQTRDHAGKKYVAIEIQDNAGFEETPTIFYAVLPGALCLSFSSRVIENAIDRANGRANGVAVPAEQLWSGQSAAMRIGGAFRDVVAAELIDIAVRDQMRARSWANLAILNEWKRLGVADPLAYHEERWGTRLVCPGGGAYVWNESASTMESTAYGHPAGPKEGPMLPPALETLKRLDFGLDFASLDVAPAEVREGQRQRRNPTTSRGLRARVKLRR